jgi:soluble lytic murein transglycosylase-like protein
VLTLGVLLGTVSPLRAEVIVFASGRTLSVKDYVVSGETITVTFRNGGDATFLKSIVARIDPDEVIEPVADAGNVPAAAVAPQPSFESRPFARLIESVASEHGIDPALVHAVVEAESNYQTRARSQVGARGLMQLMPATARDLGVTSARTLFEPQVNVEAGVKYLKQLLARFDGNLPRAIAAYNAGPGAVLKYDGVPPFPETRDYVKKVLGSLETGVPASRLRRGGLEQ